MIFFFIMFFVIFTITTVSFIVIFSKTLSQWNKNNKAPRLTVFATIVSKRMQSRATNNVNVSHTTYYVTFEVESGDRMELYVPGIEYGMLVEGDYGKLTFQGTRFIEFSRE